MNRSYIRQDNKLAVAHFKKLGCKLVPGYNTSSWYEGDNLKVTMKCLCYYVYGHGFDTMSKTAFRNYLIKRGLRIKDQLANGKRLDLWGPTEVRIEQVPDLFEDICEVCGSL